MKNNNLLFSKLAIGLRSLALAAVLSLPILAEAAEATKTPTLPKAVIDGTGLGWKELTFTSFTNVNCRPETWRSTNGLIHCTGEPTGVIRSLTIYTNFEMVAQWRHLKSGGNSGIFVWASPDSIKKLEAGQDGPYPSGIEVQVLDHGYTEQFERDHKKKADWFTTNGDVFPIKQATMKPFPPVAPDGQRSFPRKNLSKGINEWNHYYIRAVNGEIRLWVNGEEVSGGSNIKPAFGYLCLESEGAPIDFKELRIRELP
ncbi:MAG: 3-keto-disaccharide hydrolase [Verrucomicrobiales bacterium]